MAKHEFGMMQVKPMLEECFNEYEPDKYHCIALDDDLIEPILGELQSVECYWHTLQNAGKGLAYCGITLIPPNSMEKLIGILSSQDKAEYMPLIALAEKAKAEYRYIIHFGI